MHDCSCIVTPYRLLIHFPGILAGKNCWLSYSFGSLHGYFWNCESYSSERQHSGQFKVRFLWALWMNKWCVSQWGLNLTPLVGGTKGKSCNFWNFLGQPWSTTQKRVSHAQCCFFFKIWSLRKHYQPKWENFTPAKCIYCNMQIFLCYWDFWWIICGFLWLFQSYY